MDPGSPLYSSLHIERVWRFRYPSTCRINNAIVRAAAGYKSAGYESSSDESAAEQPAADVRSGRSLAHS